jgi:tRNA (cmo5U34)-methyltransferase
MKSTFDYIAPFYDTLAFMVYGNNLRKAKMEFFHLLPKEGRLLLMGGGTGTMLDEILASRNQLIIDYVEASPKMISIARKNSDPRYHPQINFITGNHLQIPSGITYDAVTSFFVIDCMSQSTATAFATAIIAPLKTDGFFLFADFFHSGNIFQEALLWFMYRFFRFTAGIEAATLPDYKVIFGKLPLQEISSKNFLNGFIRSKAFMKSGSRAITI